MLTFRLHWQDGRTVDAVVDADINVGPYDLARYESEPTLRDAIVIPLAVTLGSKEDVLRFLERNTREATGEMTFTATPMGLSNLEALFPGPRPIDQNLPLPPEAQSDGDTGSG
jgi:hypothetical protein